MTYTTVKTLFCSAGLAIVTSGVLGAVMGDAAWAQRANRNNQQASAPAEGRQFSASTGEIVAGANEDLSANNYAGAVAKLQQAISLPSLNPYERSVIYQMTGAAYYQMGQSGQALTNFENSISAGGLTPQESDALRVNIAQLLVGDGQYARGAQMLEDWNRRGGQLTPQLIETLYQAWVQAENYSRALPWAERWFSGLSNKTEGNFNTMNFLYNTLNMPGKQADIVKEMIQRWPEKKQYWDAWKSMLANGGREQDAFEVQKMLYLGGVLKDEADLLQVVQYYSFYEMPYQAADILEREMNAGRINKSPDRLVQLSNLLRQSREYKRAIPVLEQAANQSGTAKLWADLGEAYYNEKQCTKSRSAFDKAINLGYDSGKALMQVGNCVYELAQAEDRLTCTMSPEAMNNAPRTKLRNQALSIFNQVPVSSRENRNAKKWRTFIAAEESAFKKRCEFEASVEKEQCFIAIRQGYAGIVLSGGELQVSDTCLTYVPEYDSRFRKSVTPENEK